MKAGSPIVTPRSLKRGVACALVGIGMAAMPAAASAEMRGEPQVVFRAAPHDMLYGLSLEGRNGVAVGDFGLIVETDDGGKTWKRQAAEPTNLGLFAIARKAGKCVAGGQQGLIIVAEDCRQWRKTAAVTNARILSVDMNANGVAYAVGAFGTLLKSSDWGKTWRQLTPDWKQFSADGAEPHLYDVHVAADGEVTVVGEFEMVLRSRDGGATWSLLHKGRRSLFAVKVMGQGEIYAVGQEGLILKSADGGAKWAEMPSGTQSILTQIWARPDGQAVASGIYTILYSEDGGKSWQMDRSRPARMGWHQAVAGNEEGNGRLNVVLVGSGGAILSVRR